MNDTNKTINDRQTEFPVTYQDIVTASNQRVGVILSGGNVDLQQLSTYLPASSASPASSARLNR